MKKLRPRGSYLQPLLPVLIAMTASGYLSSASAQTTCTGVNEYPNWTARDWSGGSYNHANAGDQMVYQNRLYQANWYTTAVPGSDPSWTSLGRCGSTAVSSSSAPRSSSSRPSSSSSSSSSSSVPSSSSSSSSSTQPQAALVVAINTGGLGTTYNGYSYREDAYFSGGRTGSTTDNIAGTTEDTVFQSERYGSYSYNIPVTRGTYSVDMQFAEIYQTAAGERQFNVSIEGQEVLSDLDLYSLAGSDGAYTFEVNDITVTDGSLDITIDTIIDNGTMGGFAVFSADGSLAATPSSSSSSSSSQAKRLIVAVNAGGNSTTYNGIPYRADAYYSGGDPSSTTDNIAGTSQDTVFQSERYGSYSYNIPVSEGSYSIDFQFAEIFQTAAGAREFNILVEDQLKMSNVDLFALAGADTAYTYQVDDVQVSDGSLDITVETITDNGTIGGFAVYSPNGTLNSSASSSSSSSVGGCTMPSRLSWTSTSAIIGPGQSSWASIKDPTIVRYNDRYHVFATVYDQGISSYGSVYFNFSNWSQADSARQTYMRNLRVRNTVAPQVFYFEPQKRWYLITQWGGAYSTTTNISDPTSWSAKRSLLQGEPSGSLDFWVICDDANCYLFFSRDDGALYMSKTSIGNFPNFRGYTTVMSGPQSVLFEASNVYKVQGTNQYLLLVEGWQSGPRFFRAWTSNSLDGPWRAYKTDESSPFMGTRNVSFPGGQWTNDISHGEMIRSGYDEKMEIDGCNMQYLYQGRNPYATGGTYNQRPYRLGVLTQD